MSSITSAYILFAAILAIMTTAVSLRSLKGNPTLKNPVISICVGLLSFLGLLGLPAKWRDSILLGYAALAITLLLLLLLAGLMKIRAAIQRHFNGRGQEGSDIHRNRNHNLQCGDNRQQQEDWKTK